MTNKVSELSADEMKEIISSVIEEKLKELIEDFEELSSSDFISYIKEAREDHYS